jgi:hypothetical protein
MCASVECRVEHFRRAAIKSEATQAELPKESGEEISGDVPWNTGTDN